MNGHRSNDYTTNGNGAAARLAYLDDLLGGFDDRWELREPPPDTEGHYMADDDRHPNEHAEPEPTQALNSLRTDDEGHADAVLMLYPNRFLFVPEWGWLSWTGTHYDGAGGVLQLRRAVVDTMIRRMNAANELRRDEKGNKIADAIQAACRPNTSRVKAVVTALEAHLDARTSEFDADPHLLNTASGVVDLRTKKLHPHNPAQRFVYCLETPYDPQADDSEWRKFLTAAIAGGEDVLDVVQVSMGYWVTGETAEEKIWYIWGASRSGKGTTMETIQALLGERLFGTAQFNTFTKEREGNDQGFDLAGFHAARVVFAEESNVADYLNPGKVKAWTGGGTIKCAFKNKDQFSYRVRWKGVLASNHALKTDATDDAIWSRVQIWHYPHSHLGEEDLLLKGYMRSPDYLRGVLRFIVDGAARWYALRPKGGIASVTPASMTLHKAQRRAELDLVGRWIDENCLAGGAVWTTSETLYRDFSDFCKDNGQKAYSNVEWGKLLTARGHTKERRMSGGRQKYGYVGLALTAEAEKAW